MEEALVEIATLQSGHARDEDGCSSVMMGKVTHSSFVLCKYVKV